MTKVPNFMRKSRKISKNLIILTNIIV